LCGESQRDDAGDGEEGVRVGIHRALVDTGIVLGAAGRVGRSQEWGRARDWGGIAVGGGGLDLRQAHPDIFG